MPAPHCARRVVVTGIGMVTPLGIGLADSWKALTAGRSGVVRLTEDQVPGLSALPAQIAATVSTATLAGKADI